MQMTLTTVLLEASPDQSQTVLQLLLKGGWYIMIPMALMSLIGMYVFFERTMAIKKPKR